MSEQDDEALVQASAACSDLINNQLTLILSTYSEAEGAEISYAPYTRDETGIFYIFTSELAPHTANMQAQGQASVIFIKAEADTHNPFARERATFNCQVNEINPCVPLFHTQLSMPFMKPLLINYKISLGKWSN